MCAGYTNGRNACFANFKHYHRGFADYFGTFRSFEMSGERDCRFGDFTFGMRSKGIQEGTFESGSNRRF